MLVKDTRQHANNAITRLIGNQLRLITQQQSFRYLVRTLLLSATHVIPVDLPEHQQHVTHVIRQNILQHRTMLLKATQQLANNAITRLIGRQLRLIIQQQSFLCLVHMLLLSATHAIQVDLPEHQLLAIHVIRQNIQRHQTMLLKATQQHANNAIIQLIGSQRHLIIQQQHFH
jgi:hypothetical protein